METQTQNFSIYNLSCTCSTECEDKGVRYIGLTTQRPTERLRQHQREAKSGATTSVYRWMSKHTPENIQLTVQATATDRQMLDQMEIEAIADARRQQGQLLLNLSVGGEGSSGYQHTDEAKAKISAARSGEKNPNFGKPLSAEYRAKISVSKTGKKFSAEHLTNLSAANKAKPRSGMHVRWHVNRNIINPECEFCINEGGGDTP